MATTASKIAGWDWLVASLTTLRNEARAEAERLLGPDRGQ